VTEIYLCGVCSCQEILRRNGRGQSTGRNHIGVRRSSDNMASWSGKYLIEAGSSAGYSCLVDGVLKTSTAAAAPMGGILFESSGSGNINFAKFPTTF
jgi:hypothetical protein